MVAALDRAIAAVSPAWAARRAHARLELARAERSFKAVSKGRRAAEWNRVSNTEPTEASADLATLRQRAREMRRNNPYWGAGVRAVTAHVVGHGIRASVLGPNQSTNGRVQRAWEDWAKTQTPDVTGRSNFYGLQALAMGSVVQSGEILVRRYFSERGELQLQFLGPEYLDVAHDTARGSIVGGGRRITGGVEHDRFGKPVAYHLFRDPQNPYLGTSRVPAEEIAQAFDVLIPGQLRGVSWVANVFTRLADWDEFEDAELMRQKVAACFGMVYVGAPAEGRDYQEHDKLEPGMVEHLPPGTDVHTVAPAPNQSLEAMSRITHRAIASGLGITYEALTGDYSQVNFSSARMANLAMHKNVVSWQRNIMVEQLLDRIFGWFLDSMLLQGVAGASACTARWAAPASVLVDPAKEVPATNARIRAGLVSWSGAVREAGGDPEETLAQIEADNKEFDRRGIVLDSDPRKVSLQGQGAVNTKEEGENADPPEE